MGQQLNYLNVIYLHIDEASKSENEPTYDFDDLIKK